MTCTVYRTWHNHFKFERIKRVKERELAVYVMHLHVYIVGIKPKARENHIKSSNGCGTFGFEVIFFNVK